MTIIDAIKKGLKAAGVNEKYAVKVQKLFKIEKEDDIDTYIALFKDNILPDLENTSAIEKAKKDAIAEYEKNNGLKDGKPIKSAKKTKKTVKSEDDDEEDDDGSKPQSTSTKTDSASAGDSDPFRRGQKPMKMPTKSLWLL